VRLPPWQARGVEILTARDAADLFEPHFADAAGERLVTAFLAADGCLLALDARDEDEAAVTLPMRAIVARALALDATGLVIAHNHPSGDPSPSAEDVRLTRRFAMVCDALGIVLHDHLIFAGGKCESFRRLGLL
jgi:DNA repair protein RadC